MVMEDYSLDASLILRSFLFVFNMLVRRELFGRQFLPLVSSTVDYGKELDIREVWKPPMQRLS